MSNLVPGDLAIIIESALGMCIGKIVQCISIDGEHSLYGTIWMVKSKSELVSEYGARGNSCHVPEKWLKKIMPPELPSETTNKQKEKVE